MAIKFRKSIKIAPGIKMNLNKKSAGITVGGKGVHFTANTSGTKTTSVGIPGTGLYYTDVTNSKRKKQTRATHKTKSPATHANNFASSNYAQPKTKSKGSKASLIILRIVFAVVAIVGSYIFTYGAEVIGGIIFAVGAFLFWATLKMKPEDLDDDINEEEDISAQS